VILEQRDVRMRACAREQHALDLAPGRVAVVEDPPMRVAALAAEVEGGLAEAGGSVETSKSAPSLSSASIIAGPRSTTRSTTSSRHRPSPATSVSCTCDANESSLSWTAAIPPCAQLVAESAAASWSRSRPSRTPPPAGHRTDPQFRFRVPGHRSGKGSPRRGTAGGSG
jgi:hypothetical protein